MAKKEEIIKLILRFAEMYHNYKCALERKIKNVYL
jgi:hypothetical protein